MTGYREKALDPYRSPDALIEHLCTYVTDDKAIAIHAMREFGGTVTEANVRAARKRLVKPEKQIEPDNDSEWVWRQKNYVQHNRDFVSALRRAGHVS